MNCGVMSSIDSHVTLLVCFTNSNHDRSAGYASQIYLITVMQHEDWSVLTVKQKSRDGLLASHFSLLSFFFFFFFFSFFFFEWELSELTDQGYTKRNKQTITEARIHNDKQ